jgi:hypothetical protein
MKWLTVFLLFYIILLDVEISAQVPDSDEDKLKSELPERVLVTIIDTTMIQLVQRERFTDSVKPRMDKYLGIYAKERPWNLPDILTPPKFTPSRKSGLLKNSLVLLTIYPSFPQALFYQGFLSGHLEDMDGLLYFNRQNLFDSRTENRGKYNVDNFRGVWGYNYRDLTNLKADIRYDAKNLGWLREPVINESPEETNLLRKDIALFDATFDWRQRFAENAQSKINFNITSFRMDSQDSNETDIGTDVGINVEIATYLPFGNPIELGGGVEYFVATDKYPDDMREEEKFWSPIFRLYFREKFINIGAFNFRADVGAVGFRERKTDGGYRTYLQPNPSITIITKLSDNLVFQLDGSRTIKRKKYDDLYFYNDYIALNPFLKFEKTWRANATLKLTSKEANIEATGFSQMVDDLVFLNKTENVKELSKDVLGELSWTPDNLDAYIFGGQFKFDLLLAEKMKASMRFIHEFQQLKEEGQYIPYRPQDTLSLSLSYSLPNGFGFNLVGEANGSRFYDLSSDDTLPPYFLWQLKLSKIFSQYIRAFIGGQFRSGDDEILKGYKLPKQSVDFGISLEF